MVVKLTDVILCSCSITSIKTSYMWCLNFILDSPPLLLDNLCMNKWSIKCTTSQWPRYLSFGIVFLTSSIRKTLTCKWACLNGSYKVISWEIHCFTELELTALASQHGSSLNGSCMLWSTQPSYSTPASGYSSTRQRTSPMEKILVSGLVACLSTVFAFL